jgi:hypothetical protein
MAYIVPGNGLSFSALTTPHRIKTLGEAMMQHAALGETSFAQAFAQAKTRTDASGPAAPPSAKTGSDSTTDYGAENFLQYVFARANDKSTDAKDATILRNDAGALVMLFAGYYPAGTSYQDMADRFLADVRPLY